MSKRSIADFKRALEMFCREHDLLYEEESSTELNERIVVFERDGHNVKRFMTLVLRKNQEEIKPKRVSALVNRLRRRAEEEMANKVADTTSDALNALIAWLVRWFG